MPFDANIWAPSSGIRTPKNSLSIMQKTRISLNLDVLVRKGAAHGLEFLLLSVFVICKIWYNQEPNIWISNFCTLTNEDSKIQIVDGALAKTVPSEFCSWEVIAFYIMQLQALLVFHPPSVLISLSTTWTEISVRSNTPYTIPRLPLVLHGS